MTVLCVQDALLKRIELLEMLLMLQAFTGLVPIETNKYRSLSDKCHKEETIVVETYVKSYQHQASFCKQYHIATLTLFKRLCSAYLPKDNPLDSHLAFFKTMKEVHIVKYIREQQQCGVYLLCEVLFNYLKAKTQKVLQIIKAKQKEEIIQEKVDPPTYQHKQRHPLALSQHKQRHHKGNLTSRTGNSLSLSHTLRESSIKNECHFQSIPIQTERRCVPSKGKVNHRFRLLNGGQRYRDSHNKISYLEQFMSYYASEWDTLHRNCSGMELSPLFLPDRKAEWGPLHLNHLISQSCMRNELCSQAIDEYHNMRM